MVERDDGGNCYREESPLTVQRYPTKVGTGKPLFPRLSQCGTLHITSVHHHGPGFAEIRVEVKREGAEE